MKAARTRRGFLVAVEGIDGSGKSALARALAAAWRKEGRAVRLLREPAHPDLARLGNEAGRRDPLGSAFLFTLDRALAREALLRWLQRGDWVVQDRSFYSTLAYQASAVGARLRRWIEASQRAVAVRPDLVLWLDLPVPDALARVQRRGRARSALETRTTLERARAAYRRLSRAHDWLRLDGHLPRSQLLERALQTTRRARAPAKRRGMGHR